MGCKELRHKGYTLFVVCKYSYSLVTDFQGMLSCLQEDSSEELGGLAESDGDDVEL